MQVRSSMGDMVTQMLAYHALLGRNVLIGDMLCIYPGGLRPHADEEGLLVRKSYVGRYWDSKIRP